jgi:hypothetical protein
MEAIQSDLQALQNNISLEFTADMLVEGFIESLRNDDLDTTEESLRTDILSQFQARQTQDVKTSEKSREVERVSLGVLGTKAKSIGGQGRDEQPLYERALDITGDFGGSRGSRQEKKKISFFPSVEVLANEETEGAWAMPPESKYVE